MKKRKDKKALDFIVMLVLVALIIAMTIFTATRETGSQEIILMEIYKCAGPNTSTAAMEHYYVYENTNFVGIRNANSDGSNNIISKEIEQTLITNLKNALDEYINQNPSINTSFYINERYTIEYNGTSIIVPNPSVAELLGYEPTQYTFYNTVDDFINTINN